MKNTDIKGIEYSQNIYDRINDAINMNSKTIYIVDDLINEFKITDIKMLLNILIEDRKKLVHYIDTTVDLYATDRPDLINDDKDLLFKLEYKPF